MPSRETARNSVLNLLDLTFLHERVKADPSIYGTAVSTACDFKCPHCMREALGIRENKMMDPEMLAKRRDEIKTARRVSLYGLGEPFLNPRFFEFVKLCKEIGVEVATSSHGMSLTPEVRERILETGLDEINVSMDGATKPTYERLRVGGIFETVVENLSSLSRLKKEKRSKAPELNINMTILRSNLQEAPKMVRLAHQVGANSVSFSSVVIYRAEDLHNNIAEEPEFAATMEKAKQVAKDLGLPMTFWRQKPVGWEPDHYDPASSYGCSQLWSNQIIEPDGRMKLCCYIEEDITNVFERGPRESFNCEGLVRERKALLDGRVRPECQGCLYLRERTPSWVQSMINEATRMACLDPHLAEEDRIELIDAIAQVQAEKDAMYPLHKFRKVQPVGREGGKLAWEVWEPVRETELPVY